MTEEVWGVQRLIETEICMDCGEDPCICAQLFDEAEEWEHDPEGQQ